MTIIAGILAGCGNSASSPAAQQPAAASTAAPAAAGTISIVAAENFYGDIAKQIGGDQVVVVSILSDPAVDPHEYESNVQNAVAVTKAKLVIENGGGYDDWMDKLLSASPDPKRVVLTAFDIAQVKLPDNEHVWYSIDNARNIAQAIADSLKKLDAVHVTTYEGNLQKFNQSLAAVQQKLDAIKAKYGNTPVGLTETIFLYQSGPMNLQVLIPLEFQKAVAEGNDPPADTVAAANDQISNREIKVLIYNAQTDTPLTNNLKSAAQKQNIPLVAVTETMPTGKSYQMWMLDQLNALEQALASVAK
ncbi:MAG: zinc ABC transporter substrate-binding protein [Chloroflexi bacterium]|nr:zinc ABC transporter substrate-binding protein [Chloroflexota bacterium]